MSSRHHERIKRLVTWVRQRSLRLAPLFVFHGTEALPNPSQAELDEARAAGRPILNIHFVKAEGELGVNGPAAAPARSLRAKSLAEHGVRRVGYRLSGAAC